MQYNSIGYVYACVLVGHDQLPLLPSLHVSPLNSVWHPHWQYMLCMQPIDDASIAETVECANMATAMQHGASPTMRPIHMAHWDTDS